MSKGKKPIPDELKRLRGTAQPCRIKPAVVGFAKTDSVPKVALKPTAKKLFKNIAQELINCGILDNVSVPLLSAYAHEMATYYELSAEVEIEGYTISELTQTGIKIKINPKRTAALQSLHVAKTIASDFGFTPATKAKIAAVLAGAAPKDDNEFTTFEQL